MSIQPVEEFAALGGIFSTPYDGDQISARADVRLHANHSAFARYTYDRNSTFAIIGPSGLPSSWSRRTNQAEQGLAALTSVLSPQLVNDLRFSYFPTTSALNAATAEDCPNCFGLGAVARLSTRPASYLEAARLGVIHRRPLSVDRQPVLAEGQPRPPFRLRLGTQRCLWRSGASTAGRNHGLFSQQCSPGCPDIPLPDSFTTYQEIRQLPFQSLSMTVGSPTVLWAGFRTERVMDLFRLYVTDTWRASSRLTLNYGLGWSYEPNALTHDLTKPALLTPILGADGLRPPAAQKGNLSPTFGFAWTATSDGRTVVRGGVGRYFDPAGSTNAQNLINERHLLSPIGTGSLTRTGANILHDGRPLEFLRPTPLTGADVVAVLPSIRADLLQTLNPGNRDLTIRNLDSTKEGQNLYDPDYATPYAVHASLGFQRELAPAPRARRGRGLEGLSSNVHQWD